MFEPLHQTIYGFFLFKGQTMLGLELGDYIFILLERTAHTNTPLAKNNDGKAKLLAEASHHFRQSSTAL